MNTLSECIGSRVRYGKPTTCASRNGWEGTIRDVAKVANSGGQLKVFIEWDAMPDETTPYRCDAVVGFDRHGRPIAAEHTQYLHILPGVPEDTDEPLYIVAGENGGKPERVRGQKAAHARAHELATHSKSGQRYIVFAGEMGYERAEPPVRSVRL